MVINENNSQINSFVKGMNSDTAYDQLDNQSYVYGKNVRITKNTLLGEEANSSVHEGMITPVLEGYLAESEVSLQGKYKILAVKSIDEIGVIIAKNSNSDHLYVYTFEVTETEYSSPRIENWKKCWSIDVTDKKEEFDKIEQISAVVYKELENVIKLYIATGVYPIIEIRIDQDYGEEDQNVDYFINNRILPAYPVFIKNVVTGSLKTSQVQYTYRYYNKFGTSTQLAPLTNKIQVIDHNRNKEVGNAQDTTTSLGFTLKINNVNEYSRYDRLQIFRLQYIKPGEDANVFLIYDGDVQDNIVTDTNESQSTSFVFNDVGATPLAELTMEEFSSMSGLIIIPKTIEQNQQYLFASNVKDDTIIQGVTVKDGQIKQTSQIDVLLSSDMETEPNVENVYTYENHYKRRYFYDRGVDPSLIKATYNNIFTSSLLRSLRQEEDYYYAIVYYDKYGRRTNAIPIEEETKGKIGIIRGNYITTSSSGPCASPIGVTISLPQPYIGGELAKDIIGCQIIRRSSKPMYQKTLLQAAMTLPINQFVWNTTYDSDSEDTGRVISPLYPSGFLFWRTEYGHVIYQNSKETALRNNATAVRTTTEAYGIWQIFSNEIDFARDDVMSKLKAESIYAEVKTKYSVHNGLSNIYEKINDNIKKHISKKEITNYVDGETSSFNGAVTLTHPPYQSISSKSSEYILFPFYYNFDFLHSLNWKDNKSNINSIKDVKIPGHNDGFSNIQINGDEIAAGGIKKYKQFVTNIGGHEYNNWCSSGIYDLKISRQDNQQNVVDWISQFVDVKFAREHNYSNVVQNLVVFDLKGNMFSMQPYGYTKSESIMHASALRWIGPGSSCFLISTEDKKLLTLPTIQEGIDDAYAYVCNIKHNVSDTVSSEPDEFVQYFGFGNWFNLKLAADGNSYNVVHNFGSNPEDTEMVVYDGDVYVTLHEIITMFKTYDFTSVDTIPSMQIVNYIPLESKVNTCFNYGMNFLNTHSANLLFEPGSIDGICTQDRPLHQYNQIYSANDESNDVFTLINEESENVFKQRTYYSEPKTNGEYIDNFMIFKPASFIDVDSKYGEITNLLTDKNTLYYWQDTAFGKFSVNERSLINDQNGNTIMLGQAGILSRNDYISTKYGMRPYDYCAIGAENGIYWIDVNNKAIVASSGNDCINLGERLNVQNIINSNISNDIPKIDYDLQNNELLCNCLTADLNKVTLNQLVFNLKLNIATSIYNRDYYNIINIKNNLYGIKFPVSRLDDDKVKLTKYNNLFRKPATEYGYLLPMQFSFLVNSSASTTKVFDSQQLIPAKRKSYDGNEMAFFEDAQITTSFETDINSTNNTVQPYTDREGNITYNIPRYGEEDYGNRLRGKWMKVDFNVEKPTEYTTISHIITKFRQSYS